MRRFFAFTSECVVCLQILLAVVSKNDVARAARKVGQVMPDDGQKGKKKKKKKGKKTHCLASRQRPQEKNTSSKRDALST